MENLTYSKHKLKNGKEMYLFDATKYFNTKIIGSNGIYQKRNLNFIRSLKPHYNCILDIGAHVGMNAIQYSYIADKVFSIEASPYTFELLQLNTELYDLKNTKIYNFPVGNENGIKVNFKHFPGDEGNNKITKSSKQGKSVMIELETKTIDSIPEIQQEIVDFIKIDVEGYEMKVIEGAKNTINKSFPILQIEIFDNLLKSNGNSAQQLYDYLYDLGYEAYDFRGRKLERTYQKVKRICDTFFIKP